MGQLNDSRIKTDGLKQELKENKYQRKSYLIAVSEEGKGKSFG
jgi:hypothetical protein